MKTINKIMLAFMISSMSCAGMVRAAAAREAECPDSYAQWKKEYPNLQNRELHERIEIGKIFGDKFLVQVSVGNDETLTVSCCLDHIARREQHKNTGWIAQITHISQFYETCRDLGATHGALREAAVTFSGSKAQDIAARIEEARKLAHAKTSARDAQLVCDSAADNAGHVSSCTEPVSTPNLNSPDWKFPVVVPTHDPRRKRWSKWLANGTIATAAGLVVLNKFRQK